MGLNRLSMAVERAIIRVTTNRRYLRLMYLMWVAFPYPLRKPLTALVILSVLAMKKVMGVNRRNTLTLPKQLGSLSFWGVPQVSVAEYVLKVEGLVDHPRGFTFSEILALPAVERQVRMDCVGGFRNDTVMKGVPLASLLEAVVAKAEAETAVFHCADGYYTTHTLDHLLSTDAFLAYEVNGQHVDRFGFPLRLAAPGTYGYKWAKWIARIELVAGFPKGHWERLGLPRRGEVGDIW